MRIYKSVEIIDEDIFNKTNGESVTVVKVVSKKMADYILSKSKQLEDVDEEGAALRVAIDGEETNIVFDTDSFYERNDIEDFIESLLDAIESTVADYDEFEEIFDDLDDVSEDIINSIKHMEWFTKLYVGKNNLDYVEDMYFEEAKKEYAIANDIDSDDVDDDEVTDYIYDADFAYVTETITYEKSKKKSWSIDRTLDLW